MLSIEQPSFNCYYINMDISSKVRKNIKAIRTKKKVSQGDIAKALGVHISYISQIERGIRNPTLSTIEKIAGVLGVSIKDLIK